LTAMTGLERCPVCKRAILAEPTSAAYRPFCSQRCRLADLGSWLNGSYRISQPISEEDLDQGAGQSPNQGDETH
jgi:endogenous inhibitor of DNA gyrase (YacG/DUF329 family)